MNVLLDMPKNIIPGIQDMVRVFYPDVTFNTGEHQIRFSINFINPDNNGTLLSASGLAASEHKLFNIQKSITLPPGADLDNQKKRLSRLIIFRMLQMVTGGTPTPWGIFTGIRPTKIVHKLLDEGLGPEDIVLKLKEEYAVREDKALLLNAVATLQRPYLPKALPKAGKPWSIDGTGKISIYIGIPFCPTRCLYCSFPAYPLGKFGKWLEPYVMALFKEINSVGNALKDIAAEVQSIYIGGGTPTCLPPAMLDSLLGEINSHLRTGATIEFTVEGGRPDTLNRGVLEICAAGGVDRISINPQTMQQKTLNSIGRSHTVEDIHRAMAAARQIGFKTINMDIILGLPGETATDAQNTMAGLIKLRPENISVHTLAVKRASRLRKELEEHSLPGETTAREMLEASRRGAESMGMRPYYLYRQKRMLGNLENVGYSLPGHECVYNIQIMEERQTVLGLGARAGTKWVRPEDWFLTGDYNPKEPHLYVERIEELIAGKINRLHALAGVFR